MYELNGFFSCKNSTKSLRASKIYSLEHFGSNYLISKARLYWYSIYRKSKFNSEEHEKPVYSIISLSTSLKYLEKFGQTKYEYGEDPFQS